MYIFKILILTLTSCLVAMPLFGQSHEEQFNVSFLNQNTAAQQQFLNTEYATGWWSARYLIDYAFITGGIIGYAIGKDLVPRSNSVIGPSYDPDNLIELFQSNELNEPFLEQDTEESVPEYWIHRSIALSGAFLAGMEWKAARDGHESYQRLHDTFIGYAEAVALNAAATELLKPVFARLRPDFRERALRFHCQDLDPQEYSLFCADYFDRPLAEDPDEAKDLLEDGRKSFYSGHSSNSFALFGYTALAIGGRYVWGEDVTRRSRVTGITVQTGLMSFATYISASRVKDGRHFVSDTIVGAAAGTVFANLSYWRRFNRSGELRRGASGTSGISVTPYFVPGSVSGVRLGVHFN